MPRAMVERMHLDSVFMLQLINFTTFSKLPNLSVPWFPYIKLEHNKNIPLYTHGSCEN